MKSDIPGFKSQLVHSSTVWPWAGHFPSLSLYVFADKVGIGRIEINGV